MLRLDYDQYDAAVAAMTKRLQEAEHANLRTIAGRAMVMLEALGVDFDVAPVDPGPVDTEIDTFSDVWPEPDISEMLQEMVRETADAELVAKARDAAIDAGVRANIHGPVRSRGRWL